MTPDPEDLGLTDPTDIALARLATDRPPRTDEEARIMTRMREQLEAGGGMEPRAGWRDRVDAAIAAAADAERRRRG